MFVDVVVVGSLKSESLFPPSEKVGTVVAAVAAGAVVVAFVGAVVGSLKSESLFPPPSEKVGKVVAAVGAGVEGAVLVVVGVWKSPPPSEKADAGAAGVAVEFVELLVVGSLKSESLFPPPSENALNAGAAVVVVAALKAPSLFPPSEKVGAVPASAGLPKMPDPKILLVPVVFEVMMWQCRCDQNIIFVLIM